MRGASGGMGVFPWNWPGACTADGANAWLGSMTPLQGFLIFAWTVFPGLHPGLSYIAPLGLTEFGLLSPEGAPYHSPGQRPGTRNKRIIKALKERNNAMSRRCGRTPERAVATFEWLSPDAHPDTGLWSSSIYLDKARWMRNWPASRRV